MIPWALLYPQFQVVVSQPRVVALPLVYLVAGRDLHLVAFLSSWFELKKNDGVYLALYDHWTLGHDTSQKQS